jgi:hypothetical protein
MASWKLYNFASLEMSFFAARQRGQPRLEDPEQPAREGQDFRTAVPRVDVDFYVDHYNSTSFLSLPLRISLLPHVLYFAVHIRLAICTIRRTPHRFRMHHAAIPHPLHFPQAGAQWSRCSR